MSLRRRGRKRRYIRRRRYGRSRRSKRSCFPRLNNFYSKMCIKEVTQFTATSNATHVHSISLANVNSYVLQFLQNFKYYRMYAMSVLLMPRMNAIGATQSYYQPQNDAHLINTAPNLWTLFEPETGEVNDVVALHLHPRSRLHSFNKTVRRFIKLQPSLRVNTADLSNVDIHGGVFRKTWVAMADFKASFGKFVMAFSEDTKSDQNIHTEYDVVFKYYIMLKGSAPNLWSGEVVTQQLPAPETVPLASSKGGSVKKKSGDIPVIKVRQVDTGPVPDSHGLGQKSSAIEKVLEEEMGL
ncbi:putative capsid protein [Dragonfly orbiculatusvirus]|uniref:putative capsid protein n=1 Tax=Dragonfly orbiculatusvirus TaxID=1234874 RepID=UPI00028B62A5|nr:putative capsid protein [Dragonfly orbiculatusvirus]AFS65300.1 putative capsid protein [Dragonfly orbiculatusvirus]AFS65302.1 putative capsid protein [Dragonfly orbiculatusvirus]